MPGRFSPSGSRSNQQIHLLRSALAVSLYRRRGDGEKWTHGEEKIKAMRPALSARCFIKGVDMETKTLSIPNISCGHCVMSIKKELGDVAGVSKVEGDPAGKSITLEWDAPATLEKIKEVLREINYPAAD